MTSAVSVTANSFYKYTIDGLKISELGENILILIYLILIYSILNLFLILILCHIEIVKKKI